MSLCLYYQSVDYIFKSMMKLIKNRNPDFKIKFPSSFVTSQALAYAVTNIV